MELDDETAKGLLAAVSAALGATGKGIFDKFRKASSGELDPSEWEQKIDAIVQRGVRQLEQCVSDLTKVSNEIDKKVAILLDRENRRP